MQRYINTSKYNRIKPINGFTLSEVLITLVIIGIIAAITVPVLYANYWEKHAVAAVKKAYSQLNNAVERASTEYGAIYTWDFMDESNKHNSTEKYANVIVPYLLLAKDCKFNSSAKCFASRYTRLNNKSTTDYNSDQSNERYKVVLNDGCAIAFNIRFPNCSEKKGDNEYLQNICGILYVDINGDRAPNTNGRDMFEFWITAYGIYPRGTRYEYTSSNTYLTQADGCSNTTKTGYGCAGWVIAKGNMDYLKKTVSWN